jgi:hypothetical protein
VFNSKLIIVRSDQYRDEIEFETGSGQANFKRADWLGFDQGPRLESRAAGG